MSNKSFLKFIVAFGLLAVLLIFLGVNYVPRIFASNSTKANEVAVAKLARADYLDEQFPRAIVPQRIYTSADFLNHHPFAVTQPLISTSSEFLNHHPFAVSQQLYYAGSDWIERHPIAATQLLKYVGSDWIERHPSSGYSFRSLIEAKSEK
jgi:hypothetical protein